VSAVEQPDIAGDLARVVEIVDTAPASQGMPLYSRLVAEAALGATGFDEAVRARGIDLVMAENWRMRIALKVALRDVLAIQALLSHGQRSAAELAVFAMLPELRAAAHRLKAAELPDSVASFEAARERRDGAR